MEAIPAEQLDRIRPIVDAVVTKILVYSAMLPDDAPTAADFTPPQE